MRRKSALVAKGTNVLGAAIMAAGVLVLATDAASAAARRTHHEQMHGQPMLQQSQPPNEYESLSQGRQSYPNPDRQFYVPQADN
jgi:hypothetical protein